uniref:Pdz domain containing protein n=1 Tax=Echinococcus granulosus TaxID=6210 RepID=A0A068WDK1_ECHGR|nr:pdz domain containing protein [Echinococcus granulosus]
MTWSNAQLVSWAEGVGPFFQPYLAALRASNVRGQWLSCLTDFDLQSLGVTKIGDRRCIQTSVSRLIEDYAGLEAENMQSLLFSVVCVTGQLAALLKRARLQEALTQAAGELEHQLVKCLFRLGLVVKKAASWLERGPFSLISRLAALRGVMLQHTVDLNTVFQSALKNSSLLTYVNAMLELTRGLRDQLEVVIHDCDDSLLLTPCIVERVSLRKGERERYGFTFCTNDCNVHIIQSLDSDLQAPAFSCGRIARDDEIIEVNHQLVLEWEHSAVARLIQQSNRRLDLRVRKRPAHCTDYSVNSRRQRMQLMARVLRPFIAEPQHSRRVFFWFHQLRILALLAIHFLRNRAPKRRTQLLSNSANTPATSTATITANVSHEEEKEEEVEIAQAAVSVKTLANVESESTTAENRLKAPISLSRSHSRPRQERYSQALQPPLLLSASARDHTEMSEPPPSPLTNESDFRTQIGSPFEIATTPPHTNKRRPVTLGSLDDFSAESGAAASASSTPPSSMSLTRPKNSCQGWLWLKKRTSTSFGNRYVKRWCVFKHNALYYYRNQEEENAEGLILLHGFTISPVATDGGRSGRYPFRVYNEWTQFVFAADSEVARTRWMNMLGLAAIGQSACLWTSPIGGFYPGYLPALLGTATEVEKEVIEVNPRLLEPPRAHTSGGENSSRRQPVTIHRCSSSLNFPSSSGLQQTPLDTSPLSSYRSQSGPHHHHKQQPHRHFLSVSASCLVSDATDDEAENTKKRSENVDEEAETSASQANQSPCRLTRCAAMIRRRRVRRLTEGSISPSVFLTSPPITIRPHHSSGWMSLSSETVVMASGFLGQQQPQNQDQQRLHSMGTSSGGDEGEGGSEGGSLLFLRNPNLLSPTCSLSSRSSESPEQVPSS